jgi:hypothetical protein
MTTVIPALLSIGATIFLQRQTTIRLDQQPGKASNTTDDRGYQKRRRPTVALCDHGC